MRRRGANEGNIYQRADGRWEARLHLGYRGGRRIRKSFYGPTRRDVQAQLADAVRAGDQGVDLGSSDGTMERYLLRWLADAVAPSVRPSTYRAYETLVRRHVIPEVGTIPVRKLTPMHVQAMLSHGATAGLSPRSVHHLRAVLRRALNQAVRWGIVSRNVATLVDPPRVPRFEVPAMSPAEARGLLVAVEGDRLETLFVAALGLGLRQGELLGLRWSDIDLEARAVSVRHALQRVNGKLHLVEPKSSRSVRTLVLPSFVLTSFRAHRLRQLTDKLVAGSRWNDTGFAFTTTLGTPLDGGNVTHHLHRLLEAAGLPPMRFHDLRHACASLLLAQGVHPRVVMETLGHSQISLTMNTYAHVIPELRTEAASQMDRALSGSAASAG